MSKKRTNTKKYIDIKDIPRLATGGNSVATPNPGAFTFDFKSVNAGSTVLNPTQRPIDHSSAIQVSQFQQQQNLNREKYKSGLKIAREKLANTKLAERNKVASELNDQYQIDFGKVSKNFGLDERFTRDARLANDLRKTTDAYNSKITEASLRLKGNPEMMNKALSQLRSQFYDEINGNDELRRQQKLNAQFTDFKSLTQGKTKDDYSASKLLTANEAFFNYKNEETGDFDESSLRAVDRYLDLSDETNVQLAKIAEGIVVRDQEIRDTDLGDGVKVKTRVTRNTLDPNKLVTQLYPALDKALQDEDFVAKYANNIDLDNPEEVQDWKDSYVSGLYDQDIKEKDFRIDPKDTEGEKESTIFEGKNDKQIAEGIGIAYDKEDTGNFSRASVEMDKIRDENPDKTDSELFTQSKFKARVRRAAGTLAIVGASANGIGGDSIAQNYTFGDNTSITVGEDGEVLDASNTKIAKAKIVDIGGEKFLEIEGDNPKGQQYLRREGYLADDTNRPFEDGVNIDEIKEAQKIDGLKKLEGAKYIGSDGVLRIPLKGKTRSKEGDLGFRNNNPGNLRGVGKKKGFRSFDTLEEGFDAMKRDLNAKLTNNSPALGGTLKRKGIKFEDATLNELIETYAPPSENDTEKYISTVATELGIDHETPISELDLDALALAMVKVESPDSYKALVGEESADLELDDLIAPRDSAMTDLEVKSTLSSITGDRVSDFAFNVFTGSIPVTKKSADLVAARYKALYGEELADYSQLNLVPDEGDSATPPAGQPNWLQVGQDSLAARTARQ